MCACEFNIFSSSSKHDTLVLFVSIFQHWNVKHIFIFNFIFIIQLKRCCNFCQHLLTHKIRYFDVVLNTIDLLCTDKTIWIIFCFIIIAQVWNNTNYEWTIPLIMNMMFKQSPICSYRECWDLMQMDVAIPVRNSSIVQNFLMVLLFINKSQYFKL